MKFLLLLILFLTTCETPQKNNKDCCLEKAKQSTVKKESDLGDSQKNRTIVQEIKKENREVISSKEVKKHPPERRVEWENYFSSLEKNCPYSSLPSEVIASCKAEYRTYDLSTPEKQDIYYYALLNSKDYVRRRKAYHYYKSRCNETLPIIEILEEKLENLPEWEKNEIQSVIQTCKGKIFSSTGYSPGGFSFHPEYPPGNGDINLFYTNQNENPVLLHYQFYSDNFMILPLKEQKEFTYEVPSNATLDEDIPVLVVGNNKADLKIIRTLEHKLLETSQEELPHETKEFHSTFYFNSIGKGFSPRFWSSQKPFPVYYFSERPNLKLVCNLKDNEGNGIVKFLLNKVNFEDNIYIYEGDADLHGYHGWITTEIHEE